MEQEPIRPALYDTLRRVGYSARLAAHAIFIIIASVGIIALFTILIADAI